MFRFLAKRLIYSIFVILGVSILIFLLARIVPGDPARLALGEMASQKAVEALRTEMHLNDPLYTQYYYWFLDLTKGDLGISLNTQRPVLTDVKEFLPATLELVFVAGILHVIFSFALGLLAAMYKDAWVDSTIRMLSYIFISVPSFVWALFFLVIFGSIWTVLPVLNRLSGNIVPPTRVTGMYILDFLIAGNFIGVLDAFSHVFLPSLALALAHIFQGARILRSSLVDNLDKEYIAVFTGYGISHSKIMYKYLFKPSAIPWVTVVGLDFSITLGNAFLVETIFNWPGLSRYGLFAMLQKDLNAMSVVIIIIGLIFLMVNIIVDLLIAALDPQIRLGD